MSTSVPHRPSCPSLLTRRRFTRLVLGAVPAGVFAQQPTAPANAGRRLDFQIGTDFGSAGPQDIKAVLTSAGESIWQHCPQTRWEVPGFHIFHATGSPITVFDHRPDGRIAIGITTQGTYWAQFAFQFAHEFCHALAGHANDWQATKAWLPQPKANHWLEESLCETASLFALRAMGKSWPTNPPYPNWRDYGKSLTSYAADRLSATTQALPPDFQFIDWFKQNESLMRKNPTIREKNNVVAQALLPIFEANPSAWETVACYHSVRRDPDQSLKDRLTDWLGSVPPGQRTPIRQLAGVFGLAGI